MQPSINISCPPGSQQQIRHSGVRLPNDETNIRIYSGTDGDPTIGADTMGHRGARAPPTFDLSWARGAQITYMKRK